MPSKIGNESNTGNEGNEDQKHIASLGDGWFVHLDDNGNSIGKPTKDNRSDAQPTQDGTIEFESLSNGMSADATIMTGIVLAVIGLFLWIVQQMMGYSPPAGLSQYRNWIDQMRILGIGTALCVISAIIVVGTGALKKKD